MYNFIYYFFFQFFSWKKDNDPKDSALYGVMLAFFCHGFFVVTTINFITESNFLASGFGKNSHKFYAAPFIIAIMFFVHRIFKKKSERIIEKYKGKKMLTATNILFAVLLIIVPLILGIQFLNHEQ